jgi:hypothetical protein
LHDVAKGNQDKADKLLTDNPDRTQELLNSPGVFTDYSGRKFNCTAYEYARWAKDAHMCRMLEAHMNEPTKALMLDRCEAMERNGLRYEQHGEVKNSKTFSFGPLITAYNTYLRASDRLDAGGNIVDEVIKAWTKVGVEQCELPVHVINEYCHPVRSFATLPAFNVNDKLPREIKYDDCRSPAPVALFPLVISGSGGLGVDFALLRGRGHGWASSRAGVGAGPRGSLDLAAISHLDVVRTSDLKQSLEILRKPSAPDPSPGPH